MLTVELIKTGYPNIWETVALQNKQTLNEN